MGIFSKASSVAKASWDCKKELATAAGSAIIGSGSITEKAAKTVVNCGAVLSAYERGRKSDK